MSLVPYEPFRHYDTIRREMDRLFSTDLPYFKTAAHQLGVLNVDVLENKSEIIVIFDIPGLESKEDVHIDVNSTILRIHGNITPTNEASDAQVHRKERYTGRFQRVLELPAQVSSDHVKASYKNGVLEIHMKKMKQENTKKIDIDFY